MTNNNNLLMSNIKNIGTKKKNSLFSMRLQPKIYDQTLTKPKGFLDTKQMLSQTMIPHSTKN